MEHRINQLFHQNVEATMQTVEALSSDIALAAQRMANTLLNEGKIIVAANGACIALGQLFVASLLSHMHHERPSLPAISLSNDAITLAAITANSGAEETYSQQLRALSCNDDLLLVITAEKHEKNIDNAIRTAREKNLNIIVISTEQCNDVSEILDPEHINLRIPAPSLAAVYQAQLQTLLVLTELIDFQLFGVGESL